MFKKPSFNDKDIISGKKNNDSITGVSLKFNS